MTESTETPEKKLDRIYNTIVTPVTVADTLPLGVLSYVAGLTNTNLRTVFLIDPTHLVADYGFTLFFILISIASYVISNYV